MKRIIGCVAGMVLMLGAASCRVMADSVARDEPAPEPLPAGYFDGHSRCISAWSALYREWFADGGGIKHSMKQTRDQIERDQKSRFAALVRRTWATQDRAQSASILGAWPVAADEAHRVHASVAFSAGDGLPEDCESVFWLDEPLLDAMGKSAGGGMGLRMAEAPQAMTWESPEVQRWMRYWLFVRLDE